MSIINTTLTTSPAAIYTSTGTSATTVLHFCNYTNNGATAHVWLVPNGGTATNGTIIYYAVTLTAGQTLVVDTEKIILSNGDAIYASASAGSSVTATVSYIGL